MKKIFIDSNVFLRFFTRDDQGQHERAVDLFRKADDGLIDLVTGPPVLFEIAWTLRAAYDQSRERVLDVLSAIVTLKGLELPDAGLAEEAIRLAKSSGQEFADAYIWASARKTGAEVAAFNKKQFQRLGAKLHSF
ncbi:MAG: PIN domain-containing protein [Proteobacteria bacterium]|nr:PIN domain-containing protein [Pseudomonadota bacterium]